MTSRASATDITRVVLAVLLLGILITASYLVLKPFLLALTWAATIVIASWRLMLLLQRRLGGSRGTAVLIMTVLLSVLLMVPIIAVLSTVIENIGTVSQKIQHVIAHEIHEPPQWLGDVPLIGPRIVEKWQKVAALKRDEIVSKLLPFVGTTLTWLVHKAGGLGLIVIHILLTILLCAVLYLKGEAAGRGLIMFAKRLAPGRGEEALILAAQAIRAVANGVILTALMQSALAFLGFLLCGVPYPLLLTALTFLLSVIQIGAGPVLIGAVIWLFYQDTTVAAWAFLVWAVLIMLADNLVRPFLIKRGADLPLILIFAGVIGGLLAFGVIGIFVGPVVLAVTYTLLVAWTAAQGAR